MDFFIPDRPKFLLEPVTAVVDSTDTSPFIRVKYAATTWNAKFHSLTSEVVLLRGQPVKVVGIQGNTLLIEV